MQTEALPRHEAQRATNTQADPAILCSIRQSVRQAGLLGIQVTAQNDGLHLEGTVPHFFQRANAINAAQPLALAHGLELKDEIRVAEDDENH